VNCTQKEFNKIVILATSCGQHLANVDWVHNDDPEQNDHGYSFRAAGSFIASILIDSDYMEWYCASPDGTVSDRIAGDMARLGWTPRIL
jgi:hypothetical protein